MILVELPARMTCDEKGCNRSVPVQLALNIGGGFAFRPTSAVDWQVGAAQNGTFANRCPEHHQTIQRPPSLISEQEH